MRYFTVKVTDPQAVGQFITQYRANKTKIRGLYYNHSESTATVRAITRREDERELAEKFAQAFGAEVFKPLVGLLTEERKLVDRLDHFSYRAGSRPELEARLFEVRKSIRRMR